MYPQLIQAASRLAPQLSRLGQQGAGLLRLKTHMVEPPDANVSPVTPEDPNRPRVPTSGLMPPQEPMSPLDRINQAFNTPDMMQPQTTTPRFNPAQTELPQPPATAAPAEQPRFNAAQSAMPETEEMPWWKRNAYMQTDPATGAFLDPSLAAQAQQANVAGPDLIQKFMKYFDRKTT